MVCDTIHFRTVLTGVVMDTATRGGVPVKTWVLHKSSCRHRIVVA
jgi:hypothetical protein